MRKKGRRKKAQIQGLKKIDVWNFGSGGRTGRKSRYGRGVRLIFTRGHISLAVAFKGPNVILGLYKCNYSLPVNRELGTATR